MAPPLTCGMPPGKRGVLRRKRSIGNLMNDDSEEPNVFEPEFIDPTPHAKKLEDARLAVNEVLNERCEHEVDKRTKWQDLKSLRTRYSMEKETATEKADKEFEKNQAKARKQHEEAKAKLIGDISKKFEAEQIALKAGLQNLKAETPGFVANEKTARDAYRQAEIVCAEEMTKRKVELEERVGLKRAREVSREGSLPLDSEDRWGRFFEPLDAINPLGNPDPEVADDVFYDSNCIEQSPPRKVI